MKVLGLDTATNVAGIAILDGDNVLVEIAHEAGKRSNDLLVAIDRACRETGVGPRDLDAIAVGAGPGSFTGLRIGMATAKGISFATGKPLWAVSSLAALARSGRSLASGSGDVRVAVLDARKGEVFAGCYRGDGALIGIEAVMPPHQLVAWVTEQLESTAADVRGETVMYVGDAARVFPEFESLGFTFATPNGAAVARCALAGARVDVLVDGKPAYIRPAEAEVMYPDGVPGALRRK